MTAPRINPGVLAPSEDAQSCEAAGEPLEWQRELDVAIADIDSRLQYPRRRVTDEPPALPRADQPRVSPEMIEEIACRVAELLRRDGAAPQPRSTVSAAISKTVAPAPARAPAAPPPPPEPRGLPHGIAISLRIRRPLFRWPFRRRQRRQRMIMFSDYRIT